MPERDFNKEFLAIASNYNIEASPNPILAAAEHPLMIKASRYILSDELSHQMEDSEYIEILALLRWEFDLRPDDVKKARELCENRMAYE